MDGVTKNYTTIKLATEETPAFGYKYEYDVLGNISAVYEGVKGADGSYSYSDTPTMSYIYDTYGQLVYVNDFASNEQYQYIYNNAGNITRRYRYAMNTSWSPATTLENISYIYADTNGWKDLLTSYNGQTITYDAIGNPLSYRDGITLTWQNGRELAQYRQGNNTVDYTYDVSGLRTGKTVAVTAESGSTSTVKYTYVYEGGLLRQMSRGSRVYDFIYDAYGNPVSIAYRSRATANPLYYYYGTNSRGDVVSLYDSNGLVVALYEYDAYGKLLGVKNSIGGTIDNETNIAIVNPLRYRGYVYDTETGFYYLQSRYYDPTTCRFVNSDPQYVSTGQDFNGYNMLVYCSNNPLAFSDYTGTRYIASCSVATESVVQRSASCQYERYGHTFVTAYEVPLYDQDDTSICWAYSQAMIEDYNSRVVRTSIDADYRAYEIAVERNGIDKWNQGSVPKTIEGLYRGDIFHLYMMLNEHGPLFAGYSGVDENGNRYGHAVVVTGVDIYKNVVYTNNPWGIRGSQTYSEFMNEFAGNNTSFQWKLDGYNCL